MRLMLLYGVNCTKDIWEYINPYLRNFEIDYVEYPHEVTLNAKKVDDITEWVYKNYGHHCYDAIVGHSLGGIIALQLIAKYKMKVDKITPLYKFFEQKMPYETLWCIISLYTKLYERSDLIRQTYYTSVKNASKIFPTLFICPFCFVHKPLARQSRTVYNICAARLVRVASWKWCKYFCRWHHFLYKFSRAFIPSRNPCGRLTFLRSQ